MANDKIREDEILSDDELDNVAGGHWRKLPMTSLGRASSDLST